jgi:hypothetical protein
MKAGDRRSLLLSSFGLALIVPLILVATPAGAATPNPPTAVTASFPSASSAVVSWTAPTPVTGVTITGYVVTSSPGGLTCAAIPVSTPSCLELGLSGGTSYTFGVAAWSSGGIGPSANSTASTSPSLSATTTTLTASPLSPQNLGSTVSLTAAVPASGSGTVKFESGGTTIAGCGSEIVTSGYAICTTKLLATGTDSLTAVYSGDANYLTSTSSALLFTISSSLVQPTSPFVIASTTSPFNTTLALVTTGGSGSGAISFIVANGTATGCSLSGVDLSLPTNVSGTCLVIATQASASGYLAQSSNVTTVNFFWNYATYPYSFPYCSAGDTLSDDICTHVSGPYTANANSGYVCPSGWSPPTGTTPCDRYAMVSHASCTANGGTWTGSECELFTPASWVANGADFGYSCLTPEYYSGGSCWSNSTYNASIGLGYSCPYGGSLSVMTCSISGGVGPNLRSAPTSPSKTGTLPEVAANPSRFADSKLHPSIGLPLQSALASIRRERAQ